MSLPIVAYMRQAGAGGDVQKMLNQIPQLPSVFCQLARATDKKLTTL